MGERLMQEVWFWLLLAAMLVPQSTWLFVDARKRGSGYWLWGLWGLVQFPLPLIAYWLFVRRGLWKLLKRKLRKKRGNNVG
jgi:thiol:disulfide interchange protein